MKPGLKNAADVILRGRVEREGGVPGVVAMAADRSGNVYEGQAGKRELGKDQPMTADTVLALFSCTKAITGVAVMQLVEEGKVGLDDPASKYVPELAKVQVLAGFDAGGEPKLRAPKSAITVGQLLLHTSGFGYDIFSADLVKYGAVKKVPNVISSTMASMRTPLLFDPGTSWAYGCGIDWAGKVVESVRGARLGEVMHEHIFQPLDMHDTGFGMSAAMRSRRGTVHQRGEDGGLTALSDFELPPEPETYMGGHGLYGTVGDYMKFIRMVLNDGAGANGRVLKPETVALMARNSLPGSMKLKSLPPAIPSLSNEAEFFPGMPKSWGYSWMINEENAPTGRPAGALAWAGLGNLYYWIDRKNGIGGFWATQILPFADPASINGFYEFETAVYSHLG